MHFGFCFALYIVLVLNIFLHHMHACNLYVAGKYQVVFISPELLLTEETWRGMLQSPLYKQHLVGFIIDEAHCIIKW